jgi:hypothetical protein
MLAYPELKVIPIFGTKTLPATGATPTVIATSATLTAAYSGNAKSFAAGGNSELVVSWKYTTGTGETGTTLDIQVLNSNDNVNFYNTTNESASTGTSTLYTRTFAITGGTGATAYSNSYRLDITYPFIKIQVQEGGVSSNFGTLFMEGTLGGY